MGYSTNFKGELRFTHELSASQLALINSMLGEDLRDHPEWHADRNTAGYIDLELRTPQMPPLPMQVAA